MRAQIPTTRRIIEIRTQSLELLRRQFALGQVATAGVVAQEAAPAQTQAALPTEGRNLQLQPFGINRSSLIRLEVTIIGHPLAGERLTAKESSMKADTAPQVLPRDQYNSILVANLHPPEWRNPEPSGRYDLVVIGAGTAGLVTAAGAAGLGARVALVENISSAAIALT